MFGCIDLAYSVSFYSVLAAEEFVSNVRMCNNLSLEHGMNERFISFLTMT